MKLRHPSLRTLLFVQAGSIVVLVIATLVLAFVVSSIASSRSAERRAADQQAVARCFSSAATTPALVRVLIALEAVVGPRGRQDLRNFRHSSIENAPTIRECRRLADSLNVPRQKVAE